MKNVKENTAIVRKYLAEHDWHVEEVDHGEAVTFHGSVTFDLKDPEERGGFTSYKFMILVTDDAIQSYAAYPTPATGKTAEAADFISRANFGMRFGSFELNPMTAEVRFHIAFPEYVLDRNVDEALHFVLGCPPSMLHKYSLGYIKVIMCDASPEDAIREIER